MNTVYTFLADGFEEVEALAVVDLLRRASIDVITVSITNIKEVTGAHKITVITDTLINDIDLSFADLIFLPGGMPGTTNLSAKETLCSSLKNQLENKKRVAAICAAPSILGELNLLKGKRATCYPGFEDKLTGAEYTSEGVVTDGLITTARGMGFAIDLGLELIRILKDSETSDKIKNGIQYNFTKLRMRKNAA